MTTEIETKDLATEGNQLVRTATELAITDDKTYSGEADFLRQVKTLIGKIKDRVDPVVAAANAAHKAATKMRGDLLSMPENAERLVKVKIGDYTAEQQRRVAEERRRLEELARKEEEDRRLAEAEALEAAGESEQAAAVISEPVVIAPVVMAPPTPKTSGVSTRKSWNFRIVDKAKIPAMYMEPNLVAIRAAVKSLGQACQIGGIEVYEETVTSVRGY